MSERVAVVGSRNYPNLDKVRAFVALTLTPDTIVISGGARGVDSVAAEAARARGLVVEEYLAEWRKYGKSAGFLRNTTIVDKADRVVAFWDAKSRGTLDTINKAKAKGIPVEIIEG